MSSIQQEKAQQRRTKFAALLRDMFQLDQPELDFGLYRIMHAKKNDINRFIDEDLPKLAQDAFKDFAGQDKAELEKELETAIASAKSLGVDPESLPKVKELQAQYNAGFDTAREEGEVYDALVTFFSRYYDEGDFISRRVYKDGTYAIPYQGEEVVLHWANKDQYYIKSSETLRDYTLKLNPSTKAGEDPQRVHFKLVDATAGAKDNNKETDDSKRQFVLCADAPFEFVQGEPDAQGKRFEELVCRFEFRPATMNDWEASVQESATAAAKKKAPTQAHLIDIADVLLLGSASELPNPWKAALQKPYVKANGEKADYSTLKGQLNNYTKKNSFDYFIHKDLGGFLTRELDFYIKNELMQWEDIAALKNNPARLAPMLSKLDVIRDLGGKIIAFLAQLEDFQKKLWLKKKFVTETNYCITLDRVPEELYPAICANQAQHDEWVKLFAIDEIKADTTRPGYSSPLTEDFLKANQNLVLDTQFFSEQFKAELVASIDDFDEQCDGLLVHSENFQALSLLQERYKEQVKCIYIDPPYNTGSDGFAYKDRYQHSSWLSLMKDRLNLAKPVLKSDGWLFINIDEREHHRLMLLLEDMFGEEAITSITVKMSHLSGMKMSHLDRKPPKIKEYLVLVAANTALSRIAPEYEKANWTEVFERYTGYLLKDKENPDDSSLWKRVNYKEKARLDGVDTQNSDHLSEWCLKNADRIFRTAVNDSKEFKSHSKDSTFRKIITPTGLEKYSYNKEEVLFASSYLQEIDGVKQPAKVLGDIWTDIGINNLHNEGGVQFQNGKKPIKIVQRAIRMAQVNEDIVLDFFAGSGSTAHALVLNSHLEKRRNKFVCIEQGEHFNNVLMRRVKNIMFSKDWLLSKATSNQGFSLLFKYIRLESYEDTLGNLRLNTKQDLFSQSSDDEARQAYVMNYMLDVETRGSQSLLNIQQFLDPTQYQLNVRSASGDETVPVKVDLLETFNYLLGLEVEHIAAPIYFDADFSQGEFGRMQAKVKHNLKGKWWFRTVYGKNRNGQSVLVVWRNLPSVIEAGNNADAREQALLQDNAVLDAVLVERLKIRLTESPDDEIDVLYVNGDHNISIPRDRQGNPMEQARVQLIEEAFKTLMFADS